MGWVVNATPRPLYPRERDPVPIVQGTGWALGPVWTGAENLAPTGIRSPDLPARSECRQLAVLEQFPCAADCLFKNLITSLIFFINHCFTIFICITIKSKHSNKVMPYSFYFFIKFCKNN